MVAWHCCLRKKTWLGFLGFSWLGSAEETGEEDRSEADGRENQALPSILELRDRS